MKIEAELLDDITKMINDLTEYTAFEMIDQIDIDSVILNYELVACNLFIGNKDDYLLEKRDYDYCKALIIVLTNEKLDDREFDELIERTGLMGTEKIIGIYTSEKLPADLCKILTVVTK